MQWMEKCRCSARHPQVLIGIVVASLLIMVGFQTPSSIKAVSKTNRLERLQTADLSRNPLSPHRQDCTDGLGNDCKTSPVNSPISVEPHFANDFSFDEVGPAIVAVAVTLHVSRDFSGAAPRAPPRTIW